MADIQFTKVLVGVDFSPAENALLSCLPELTQWGTQTLVLAHVIPVRYTGAPGYGHEAQYREALEEKAAPLREAGLEVETLVRNSTQPAKDFVALANDLGADLILVGSRSHNFLHKLFLGSFATKVVHLASLPVLIQRIEKTEQSTVSTCEAVCRRNLDKVLLATDLSDQAAAAERAAMALATKAGQMDVISVTGPDITEAQANAYLQDLKTRLVAEGAHTNVYTASGKASDAIAARATRDYTLIILGKHGHGWSQGAKIGSTADRICQVAQRPVLIVPG